jgi:membrane-associated protein
MHLPVLDPEALLTTFGYLGLFAIVFSESGMFFGFFLPGDSLLFTAGLFAARGFFDIWVLVFIVPIAAILGDSAGYWLGKTLGPRIFTRDDSFFFNKRHIERAERFYKKYGPKAVLYARIVPIARTFVPIVAGVGSMRYGTFLTYNILGGIIWGAGFPLLGYWLGTRFPVVQEYLTLAIATIIVLSFVPIFVEVWRERRHIKNRKGV